MTGINWIDGKLVRVETTMEISLAEADEECNGVRYI